MARARRQCPLQAVNWVTFSKRKLVRLFPVVTFSLENVSPAQLVADNAVAI